MNSAVPPPSGKEPYSPSDQVIIAVADAKGVSPLKLPPLQDVIDADALDAIIDSLGTDARWSLGSVTFNYGGYIVVVDGDGDVSVSEQTE